MSVRKNKRKVLTKEKSSNGKPRLSEAEQAILRKKNEMQALIKNEGRQIPGHLNTLSRRSLLRRNNMDLTDIYGPS